MASEHAELRQEIADYLCGRFSPEICPENECHKEANHILTIIAERTKEATQDMALAGFDQLDCGLTPHAAEDCWSAMHELCALWPPRDGMGNGREENGT
jgi:hypothetical protein